MPSTKDIAAALLTPGAGKSPNSTVTASSLLSDAPATPALVGSLVTALNRQLVTVVCDIDTTGGSPESTIIISNPDGIWLGTGFEQVAELFTVTDTSGKPLLGSNDVLVYAGAVIGGGSLGDGLVAGPVTINLSDAIPAGTQYRVYYAKGSTTGSIPFSALAVPVIGSSLDTREHILSGLNDIYRRRITGQESDPLFTDGDYVVDTAGAGAVIIRDGVAPTSRGEETSVAATYADGFRDPHHAMWFATRSTFESAYIHPATNDGPVGFVFLGSRKMMLDNTSNEYTQRSLANGAFHTLITRNHQTANLSGALTLTRINPDLGATLNPTAGVTDDARRTIQCSVANFFTNGGATEIICGYDMIKVTYTGILSLRTPETYVITEIVSSTQVRVRTMGGGLPGFPSGAATTDCRIQLLKTSFHQGGGYGAYMGAVQSHTRPVGLDTSIFHAVPPPVTSVPNLETKPREAIFLAAARNSLTYGTVLPIALSWGYPDRDGTVNNFYPVLKGYLRGDGGIKASQYQETAQTSTVSGNTTITWDPSQSSLLQINFTHAAGTVTATVALSGSYSPAIGDKIKIMVSTPISGVNSGSAIAEIVWPANFHFSGNHDHKCPVIASTFAIFEGTLVVTNAGTLWLMTRQNMVV